MHYTNLKDAKEILLDRKSKKKEVEQSWTERGVQFPFAFHEPTAVVGKPASFRIESAMCIHMAEIAELGICFLTYDTSIFTEVSAIKRSLVHSYFTDKFDKKGNFISQKVKFVEDMRPLKRVPLNKLVTADGENILSIHRSRLLKAKPETVITDMSEWSSKLGGCASEYYENYLSLFVAHGILFEDYHSGESGDDLTGFTQNIFEPAFKAVTQKFGVKPIVVKLPWKPYYAYHPRGLMLEKWRELVLPKI